MNENFDIGARLLALRQAAGLSQRQLAEKAKVPHAQISNVETNRSSPSIATMRKILSGLDLTMADFFDAERQMIEGPFFDAGDLIELSSPLHHDIPDHGPGAISFRQIGDAKRHNLQILHETYEIDADTGETHLEHYSNEGGYIIEGAIELTVGDQVRVLTAGQSYLFDSRLPHRFRNVYDGKTIIISACTPPYL